MKNRSRIIIAIMPVLACLALLPGARAVSPTPDGCYPSFTTAEGCDALSFLTTGAGNTALGWRSLFSDTTGSFNTGIGGWSAGPQQREFQYRSRRGSVAAQYHRLKQHSGWNRHTSL